MKKLILFIIAIIIAGIIYGFYKLDNSLGEIPAPDTELVFEIPPGSSATSVLNKLENTGALKPESLFKLYLRYKTKYEGKTVKAGYYKMPPGLSNREIINSVFEGKNLYTINITFQEGIPAEEIAVLAAAEFDFEVPEFMSHIRSKKFLDKLSEFAGEPVKSPEGYLLPETYKFDFGLDETAVAGIMLSQLREVFEGKEDEIEKSKLSIHEILTLASIVEAETPVHEEKPTVAGLYLNRLKIGMRLQADPTVQYAMGEKRRVLYRDLEINHPFNTYVIAGLPPGPINCPGAGSIQAVLNPENHNYLYMVAIGDGSGKHNFAVNEAGHIRNVRVFRNNRRR
jgi:UPF0755 protein